MSFREFKEEIYLILQVKEGHGFGFASNPLVITANLVGNVHESFVIEPSPQPKFENEFVWIMEKSRMKGIWADKAPIRVECFTLAHSHRSKVGYIILNVKDAQIIHDESKIIDKQIRLLGLSKEASLFKPELILSFYITDVPIKGPQLTPQYSPRLENNKVQMADGPPRVLIGSGHECFTISIEVDSTSSLKELLPTGSEIDPNQITYSYYLLGVEIVSGSSTSHSVRVDIISSLATLKTYFLRECVVPIKLFLDTLLIGETSIDIKNVILSEEFHSKKFKHHPRTFSCHSEITPTHKVTEELLSPKAFVDFVVMFSCEESVTKKKSEISTLLPEIGAGGDADSGQAIMPLQRPVTAPLTPRPSGGETYRTQPNVAASCILNITVLKYTLDQELSPQSWLRLDHPCASVSPQKCPVPIKWTPQQWQLSLTRQTLEPCTLFLMSGQQEIANATLIPPSNLYSAPTVTEQTVILEGRGQRMGEVTVAWESLSTTTATNCSAPPQTVPTFTDSSLSPPTQSRQNELIASQDVDVLSPRARELKILSFVEELEDWAEKQRILVMEGLKEEEAAWWSQWEAEVGGQVTEGRQLVKALHAMRDQLRRQETAMQENQQKLKVYKEEIDRVYRSKLQEFKDLSRRMQDEFNHKLALIASNKAILERELEKLREENTDMKQRLKEVEAIADKDKRLADKLTHDMKVLNEKLSMEQESKQFFKDHCRKAEQEIHRLNCLRQQELESRLFNEKKTLEQLAFQQIIVEKNDIKQDQKVLDEVRHQLLHRPVNSDIISNSNRESFVDSQPFADERHIRRAT